MIQKLLIILLFSIVVSATYAQEVTIYTPENNLTDQFVASLCDAARNPPPSDQLAPSKLELLIIQAAGTEFQAEDQAAKSLEWHKKYAEQCYCSQTEKFEKGGILRQVVQSNFREFANIVGPNNRLSLYLEFKDPHDGMTILEYINNKRISIEKAHDDKRFEFQQDEEWRNIMFFYFLFSEFSIN
ncbi:hypothetical protein [Fulvivirga lutea]|uniref:Uncharacterized protein n=1 Tax=Fulvivirga lutea TaxID=2810512 RepID=A0A974WKA4_9BACT|nr:hypothetical protein [Fulvivirga lutea]QSE96933.1 hypothetical protein JR347_15230 [Fulvivirga lutea]